MRRVLYANPERHDYLHATLLEGLNQRGDIEVWALQEGNHGGRATVCLRGDVRQAVDALASFDAVVVGTSGKRSTLDSAVAAVAQHGRSGPTQRWVLVDSGDLGSLPRLGVPWSSFDSVVKRELYHEDSSVRTFVEVLLARRMRHPVEYRFHGHPLLRFPNVQCNQQARPALVALDRRVVTLPKRIGVRCEPIGIEDRLVQTFNEHPITAVTCTLAPNIDARRRLRSHLARRPGVLLDLVPAGGDSGVDLVASGAVAPGRKGEHVHNDAYLSWLRAHRASVSFPGAGFDSARCWEILASGALLVSKRIELQLPVPLLDGVHYVGFDTLAELDAAIEFALSDSREVDVIRRAGHEFACAEYSSSAAAERLLRVDLAASRSGSLPQ